MRRRPEFAAVIGPHGATIVRCERVPTGYELNQVAAVAGPDNDVEDVLQRVAAVLAAEGSRRGSLAILAHGFESYYDRLSLPMAQPAVLAQVVQREMARRSGIAASVATYLPIEEVHSGGSTKLDLWAGVMSIRMRDALFTYLQDTGLRVGHVTVLPSVLATLYTDVGSGPGTGSLMICLPEGPVSGFFHDGKLRLILESPLAPEDRAGYAALCIDQLDRGALYLRQRFRGVRLDALLLAAEADIWNDVAGQVRATHDVQVLPLGDARQPMSSLLALGAVVDANVHPMVNLAASGGAHRPRSPRGLLNKLAHASYFVVAFAALVALLQLGRMTRLESRFERRDDVAWRYYRPLTAMMNTARARLSAGENVSALEGVLQQNGSLQTVLSSLATATPDGVQLDSLEITRRGELWDGIVIGHTDSNGNAEGIRSLSRFYQSLSSQPGFRDVQVEDFTYGAGVRFRVLFKGEAP